MFKARNPVREKKKELEKLALKNASLKKSLEQQIQDAKTPKIQRLESVAPKTLRVENKKAQVKFFRYFFIFLFLIGYIIYVSLR